MSPAAALIHDWIRQQRMTEVSCFELVHLFNAETSDPAEKRQRTVAACAELVAAGLLIERPRLRGQTRHATRYFVHVAAHR